MPISGIFLELIVGAGSLTWFISNASTGKEQLLPAMMTVGSKLKEVLALWPPSMTPSALLRIPHGWLMITPVARISFPGAEFALVKTVAALNGAFAPFKYTGVLFLDAVSAASKFWELSCKAVWPLMVFPAAFATPFLVVPPP